MSRIHQGDLTISTKAQAKQYADVEEVTGYLDISADAQLPVLASVGGSLLKHKPIWVLGLQWTVTILDDSMKIGCQSHSLTDWERFTDREIAEMDGRNAVKWIIGLAASYGA